jgi:hypothetical protein
VVVEEDVEEEESLGEDGVAGKRKSGAETI